MGFDDEEALLDPNAFGTIFVALIAGSISWLGEPSRNFLSRQDSIWRISVIVGILGFDRWADK